jgi:hypothetical protein
MKSFIRFCKENWVGFVTLGMLVCIVYFFTHHTKEVVYRGTILEHHVTFDKYGDPKYITIASFEDGYVRTMEGLDHYVRPIGSTIIYTIRVIK